MEPQAWRRLKTLFHQALELGPGARPAFLAAHCGAEPALAERLHALLAAHEEAGAFLEDGLAALAPELELEAAVEGLRIGPYRVISELGRGGMGAVFLAARDDATYEQKVAIKLIKRGMDSEEIVRRFVSERQILARLVHPHIARLLDGGTTGDGRPYFVMEHIEGRPIRLYCEEGKLPVEGRLRLFLAVAEAVHFAHQNLVVHRDLKPANVLVGAGGVPKLLDFGIAKLLDAADGGLTAVGSRPRTPEYSSPEQAAGGAVTTATDVYALGLLLYELLTGINPRLAAEGRGAGAIRRASQAIKTGDPRLARRLSGDLDTILGKALEEQPERRYPSVRDLAEDLERHLERRPVKARRPTLLYQLDRLARRHKLAAAAALAVLGLAVAASYQAVEAARQRDRARDQSRRAQALSSFLIDVFKVADPDSGRGEEVTARELLDAAARRLGGEGLSGEGSSGEEVSGEAGALRAIDLPRAASLSADPRSRAELLTAVGEVYQNLGLLQPSGEVLGKALSLRGTGQDAEGELETASTLVLLGHVQRMRGEHDASEASYRRALDIRRRLLGASDPQVAEAENGLGLLYRAKGETEKARQALSSAIALRRLGGEATSLALAESLSNLAALEIDAENPDAAAALIEEARELRRGQRLGDVPQTATDLSNLAGLLFQRGDFEGAAERFGQALELRRARLGNEHPAIAVTLSNLATVELERGRLEPAEESLREALAIHRRLHPAPHPDLAHTLNNLASVRRDRGDPRGAVPLFEEALALYRELVGARHPLVATCLNNLALARRDLGELAEAERLVREGLEIRREALGAEHPAIATSWTTLATVLERQGRLAEAEQSARQSLALRRRLLEPDHPAVATSLIVLGGVLVREGRQAEAEPLLIEGVALRRRRLPPEHPLIAEAESALVACRRRPSSDR